MRVTARHTVEASAAGCCVTLSIRYEGLLGPWLARWIGDLNGRYLAMEANGLRMYCAELAALERRTSYYKGIYRENH
jgi:hypothetical protein